jgi:hypothetical protein
VGNDIVDLRLPCARRRHEDKRFQEKVFTLGEIRDIHCDGVPLVRLWMTWAAKEAAYKAVRQRWPGAVFSPKKFQVHISSMEGIPCGGAVVTPWGRVRLLAAAGPGWAHCIGFIEEHGPARVEWGIGLSGGRGESLAVREALCRRLAEILGASAQKVRVSRGWAGGVQGPPRVTVDGAFCGWDVSLSHDGEYYAYAAARDFLRAPENMLKRSAAR